MQLLTSYAYTECAPCAGKDCAAKNGPAWSPVEFNGRRAAENVTSVNALVLDLDHMQASALLEVVQRVRSAGLAYVLHSTHSHRPPEDCCARLILRLSRPLTPAELSKVREEVANGLQAPWDKKTKDPSRLYFLPSVQTDGPVSKDTREGMDVQVEGLLARAAPQALAKIIPMGLEVPADSQATDLDALRRFISNARTRATPENSELLRRVLQGEALAPDGERDDSLNALVSVIAFNIPESTPDDAVLEVIRVSVRKMPGEPPEGHADWESMARAKLERARERASASRAERKSRADAERAAFMSDAAKAARPEDIEPGEDIEEPYTPERLAKFSRDQGCDPEEFAKRWVIQKGDAFYIFVNGRYQSPIMRAELDVSLPRDLARSPCALMRPTAKGDARPSTTRETLADYATVARKSIASMSLQRSYYDAQSQTLHEAVCPLRTIQPVFSPEIDEWLTLLGGTRAEKLKDWVACVMRLDRQACALLFVAKKGVGKNLFVGGLARLWHTGGATDLARIIDTHNDSIAECPLIFADENLPPVKGITAKLRTLIGSTGHTLRRMYLGPTPLQGALRVVIAGNNDRLLETGEDLSRDDIDAVAQRILTIESDPRATEYLERMGGPPVLDKWVTEDRIAAHAMYLAKTRHVEEGSRFLVEGESSQVHTRLATISGAGNAVCEFLVHYLSDPTTRTSQRDLTSVLIGSGQLFVRTELLSNEIQWTARVPSMKVLSSSKIGRALTNLSSGVIQVRIGGERPRFHVVNVKMLLDWAERSVTGDPEAIRTRIQEPNQAISEALDWSAKHVG